MPFPAVTLLDSFKRPDEKPLSGGGNWIGTTGHPGEVKEEAFTSARSFNEGRDDALWTPTVYIRPAVAVQLSSTTLSVNRDFLLYACVTQGNPVTGYRLDVLQESGVANKFTIVVMRFTGLTHTDMQTTKNVLIEVGDQVGLATAPGLQAWVKHGAGSWETVAAEVTNSLYSQGLVGVGVRGAHEPRLQNFQASGAVVPWPGKPGTTTPHSLAGQASPRQNMGASSPSQKVGAA